MKAFFFSICFLLVPGLRASERIVNYDLDPQKVYQILTAPGVATTIVFPSNIRMIDGRGFVRDAEKESGKFEIGILGETNFVTVSPLADNVAANLNVRVGKEVYCLDIRSTDESKAFFKVQFSDDVRSGLDMLAENKPVSLVPDVKKPITPARMISFIDRVILHRLDPKSEHDDFLIASPQKLYALNGVNMTLHQVYRDNSLDALCFILKLESTDGREHYYDVQDFRVQAGDREYSQFTSKASGIVERQGYSLAYFVIAGDGTEGGRNDLAPTNDWKIKLKFVDGSQRREPLLPSVDEGLLPPLAAPLMPNLPATPPVIRHEK